MRTLRDVYTVLFIVGLFFIPFNDFDGLSFLGEYKNEAATYFFLLGFTALGIETLFKGRINIPYKSIIFQLIFIFVLWTIIATLFNLPTIIDSFYKQTSGLSRFARQFLSLIISVFVFFTLYWNVVRGLSFEQILRLIRKTFLFSFIFVFVYGIIESAIVIFGLSQLLPILNLFEIFPFVNVSLNDIGRISSVTYEVPSLGNYLITISAWMFSYVATEKSKWRYIPMLMVLLLMFLSGSRTALINVSLQLIVFFVALYFKKEYREDITKLFLATSILIGILFTFYSQPIISTFQEKIESLDPTKKTAHDLSNRTRFGMQYASLQVFKKNPIVGVGLGQETYHKIYEYPFWATYGNWEFKYRYRNQKLKSFPSAYNIYTRLLAETGIIGFGIFASLLFICLNRSRILWIKSSDPVVANIALILLVSFVGLFVNWFQTDFFRQYGVWMSMAILIKLWQNRMAILAKNDLATSG